MKPELLESLLLDRALGELSPEVTALLDAHLVQHPDAARRAAELGKTVQLARAASTAPVESPHRPLDIERLRRTNRTQPFAPRPFEIFRLAACLALGLGIGWLVRTPPPSASITAARPHAGRVAVPATPPIATSSTRFWSVARLVADARAQAAADDHREDRDELRWTSPTKLPQLKDKL